MIDLFSCDVLLRQLLVSIIFRILHPYIHCSFGKMIFVLVIYRMERKCEESVEVCGISFPKDMNIIVPVHSLHRMTAIWGDPDVFRPERLVTIRSGSFLYYNNTYSTCHGKVSVPFWYHIVILSLLGYH